MQIYFLPYKAGSRSCREIAQALGARRIRTQRSRFTPRHDRLVVNWGNGRPPVDLGARVLNPPQNTQRAGNKLLAFRAMREAGVSVPDFRTPQEVDDEFLNSPFIARTQLRGSGGVGCYYIERFIPEEGIGPPVDTQLYVRYVKKTAEYRIHVFQGEVLDIQQKRKRNDVEEANFQIRNHDNGWVFCRNHVDAPDDSVIRNAVDAVSALGLDFGAVDVVWNRHYGAYVLEVNTAPGLEGTTLNNYVNKIREYAGV